MSHLSILAGFGAVKPLSLIGAPALHPILNIATFPARMAAFKAKVGLALIVSFD